MSKFESDGGIREFILEDGSKRYEARVHRRGEATKAKRFKTRKEAVAWKRKMDTAIDGGQPVLNTKTVLLSQVIDDYLKFRANSLKPLPSNKITDYERVKYDLGDISVRNLDRTMVENYLALLLKEPIKRDAKKKEEDGPKKTYAPSTVRKFFYALKRSVEWHARANRYHIDDDLFEFERGVIPDAWAGRRERRLVAGEEERLYDAGIEAEHTFTPDDWRAVIGFALETAMREQEIVFARWQDISTDGKKLLIPEKHTKTKSSRVVLLSPRARDIVEHQRAQCPKGGTRIFSQWPSPASLCDSFARLTERAKVVDLVFHDLRHEATSRLCESRKLETMEIMEMTGHKNMTTFRGYVHLLKHESSVVLD